MCLLGVGDREPWRLPCNKGKSQKITHPNRKIVGAITCLDLVTMLVVA